MKTATISLRVPIDFKETLQTICADKGITMSDYCLAKLTPNNQIAPINAKVLQTLSKGGTIGNNVIPMELSKLLGVTGGLLVGVIVYNALKENLPKHNPEWSEDKIQAIAFASGVTSALLGGIGLHAISKQMGINGSK
jgi:hypothetical protein